MTDLPRIFSSACATGRAARSAWPPAGNGTIMVTLRAGHGACANAGFESALGASGSTAAAFRSSRRFIESFPQKFFIFVRIAYSPNRKVGKGALRAAPSIHWSLLLLPLRKLLRQKIRQHLDTRR